MLYLIKNDKVAFIIEGNYNKEDYKEYDKLLESDQEDLIYNPETGSLEAKPEQETVVQEEITISDLPDYVGFYESLRGSDVWNKVLNDGSKTLKINIAVTMLIAAITSTKNLDGLFQALKAYVAAIADSSQTVDLSSEQVAEIQQKLEQFNINIKMSEVLANG